MVRRAACFISLTQRFILHAALLLLALPVFAQPENIIGKNELQSFTVLPDRGYNLKEVINNQSLKFKKTDSLTGASAYWLKIIVHNPSRHAQDLYLQVYPDFNTTLYTFDRITKRWYSHHSGVHTATHKQQQYGVHPYQIFAAATDTVYVRIDVNTPHAIINRFKAQITLTSKSVYDMEKQDTKTAWLVGITVLLLFFVNNLYVYHNFKDKSVLFYLVIQLGGMIYITSYCYFFDRLFPFTVFGFVLHDRIKLYDLNLLLMHGAIVMIFWGFYRLTQTYLNTVDTLPREDRFLRYSLYLYAIASVVIAIINVSGFGLEPYTLLYDNFYCAFIISVFIYTSLKAFVRKVDLSGAFLLANSLPLFFMLGIPLFHLLVSDQSKHNSLLPVFCVVSQALGFSIALVTRTKSIQQELNAHEIQSRELELDLKEIDYQNKLNELELAQKRLEIEAERNKAKILQDTLNTNQRELASSTLNMVQKTELLAFLKDQIQKLEWQDRYSTKKNLESLNSLLENNIQLDSDWKKFKIHFEQVHPDFFADLKNRYPSLTSREIRLYTYFQMNLSHKEIAALLGIDPASVRRAKTRLYKKMGLSAQADQPEE